MAYSPQSRSISNTNFRKRKPGYTDWILGQHGQATQQVLFQKEQKLGADWKDWQKQSAQTAQSQQASSLKQTKREFDYKKIADAKAQEAADKAAWKGTGGAVMGLGTTLGGTAKDSNKLSYGGFDAGNIVSSGSVGFGASRMFGDEKDKKKRAMWGAGGSAAASWLGGGSWKNIIGSAAIGSLASLWS